MGGWEDVPVGRDDQPAPRLHAGSQPTCMNASHLCEPILQPAHVVQLATSPPPVFYCLFNAENYIWMGEPDHVFLLAPPLWATPER